MKISIASQTPNDCRYQGFYVHHRSHFQIVMEDKEIDGKEVPLSVENASYFRDESSSHIKMNHKS